MNIRGSGWQADCPKCVASKFTCDDHYAPDIECTQCSGEGFIRTNGWPFGPACEACNGEGWRPMTDDEVADAAEREHEAMCEGEPPFTMAEQYQRAAEEKRRLS